MESLMELIWQAMCFFTHFFHQLAERVGGQLPPSMLEGLGSDIAKVADTLRSEISILVPELV